MNNNLPKEILNLIFEELEEDDLLQSQKVCRSWYNSAHLLFLENITLNNSSQVDKFIASIDHNPTNSYLFAVKSLKVYCFTYVLFQQEMEKLLFRFPNLKQLETNGNVRFFQGFNENLCRTFLERCPKLEICTVDRPNRLPLSDQEFNILCNLRLILTSVDLNYLHYVAPIADILQFVYGCPRLKQINGLQLASFQRLFPFFEQLPDLKAITTYSSGTPESENFVETYLATKPKMEQQQFLTRLSQISSLKLRFGESFCTNTLKAVSKYFTGLETFEFLDWRSTPWTDLHKQVFANDILELLCTAKNTATLHLKRTTYAEAISYYLPILARKILLQLPSPHKSTKHRVFKLCVVEECYSHDPPTITVRLDRQKSLREITVSTTESLDVNDIIHSLLSTTIDNVDQVILSFDRSKYIYCNINTYEKLLYKLQNVKEVTFEVPFFFNPGELDQQFAEITYPVVEKCSLKLRPDVQEALLDRYFRAFPNLKELRLDYYIGHENGNFELSNFSLDSLKLNIYRLSLMKQPSDYLIVDIDESERHLYKVLLQPLSITRIHDVNELKEKACAFYQVRITIASLGYLTLFTEHKAIEIDLHDEYAPSIVETRIV